MSGEQDQPVRTTERTIGRKDTTPQVERQERVRKQVNDYVFNTTLYFLDSYSNWDRMIGGGEYE